MTLPRPEQPAWDREAADRAASIAHDFIYGKNGVTQQQASDAIWKVHAYLRGEAEARAGLDVADGQCPERCLGVLGHEGVHQTSDGRPVLFAGDVERLARALLATAGSLNVCSPYWAREKDAAILSELEGEG